MKVLWTTRAERHYKAIASYIQEEFGDVALNSFKQKTTDFIELLSAFPEVGVLEVREKQIRSFLVTKQTRVFYRIKRTPSLS